MRKPRRLPELISAVVITALFFSGEIAQMNNLGPDWFRWHASDFGFVGLIDLTCLLILRKSSKIASIVAFALGVGYEIWQAVQPGYDQGIGDFVAITLATVIMLIAAYIPDKS